MKNSQDLVLVEALQQFTTATQFMGAEFGKLRQIVFATLMVVVVLFGVCVAFNWNYVLERQDSAAFNADMIEDLQLRMAALKENCK